MRRFLCAIGWHVIVPHDPLLTMTRCHCKHCGAKFINSLFGFFDDK